MSPNLISNKNFLYPKFLKPLGANSISQLNPLSFFPDGIPGYIAPKKHDFVNSDFFFDNRKIEIAKPSRQPKIQLKNNTLDSLTINFLEHEKIEQLENGENSLPKEKNIISSNQEQKIQNIPQNPNINLKSNIQAKFISHLSDIHPQGSKSNTPSIKDFTLARKIISPQSQKDISSVYSSEEKQITPLVENNFASQEAITPRLENNIRSQEAIALPKNPFSNNSTASSNKLDNTLQSKKLDLSNNISSSENKFLNREKADVETKENISQAEETAPQIKLSFNDSPKINPKLKETFNSKTSSVENTIVNRETIDSRSQDNRLTAETILPQIESSSINSETIHTDHKSTLEPKIPEIQNNNSSVENLEQTVSKPENIHPKSEKQLSPSKEIAPQPEASNTNSQVINTKLEKAFNPITIYGRNKIYTVENEVSRHKAINFQLEERSRDDFIHNKAIPNIKPRLTNNEIINTKPEKIDRSNIVARHNLNSLEENTVSKRENIRQQLQDDSSQKETINRQVKTFEPIKASEIQNSTHSVENTVSKPENIPQKSEGNYLLEKAIASPVESSLINPETINRKSEKALESKSSNLESNNPLLKDISVNKKKIALKLEETLPLKKAIASEIKSLHNSPKTINTKPNKTFQPKISNIENSSDIAENTLTNLDIIAPQLEKESDSSTNQFASQDGLNSSSDVHSVEPISSFSFVDLLPKNIDSSTNSLSNYEENQAQTPTSKPSIAPDTKDSQSQISKKDNKNDYSISESWSSIEELINETSLSNNNVSDFNSKSENKSLGKDNINLENIAQIQKSDVPLIKLSDSKNTSDSTVTVERDNNNLSDIAAINTRKNLLNKKQIEYVNSQPKNTNLNNEVYTIQLSSQRDRQSEYRDHSLDSPTVSPENTLSNPISVRESKNISPKEETPTVENENLDRTVELNEEFNKTEEDNLLDILAAEIYNLLQQRLEIERERQGKYYF